MLESHINKISLAQRRWLNETIPNIAINRIITWYNISEKDAYDILQQIKELCLSENYKTYN